MAAIWATDDVLQEGPEILFSDRPNRAPTRALLAKLAVLLNAATAAAAEVCVTCTGPDARYVCEIRALPAQAATGMQGQLLCIKELAAAGGHKTCSVSRSAPATCSGPLRVVSPPPAGVPFTSGVTPSASAVVAPVPAEPRAPSPSNGPLDAVGQGITHAARKSWSCVTSLFKDC